MIARQSLVDGEAGDQLVTLFRSKREDRRSRRSLVAGRIAPARLPKPLHIPTDHPPHVFRHGRCGTGCANLMRRIIVHAADAARNSVPLCYWVGLGRWRFSTSLSPVRELLFSSGDLSPPFSLIRRPGKSMGVGQPRRHRIRVLKTHRPSAGPRARAARQRQEGNDSLDCGRGCGLKPPQC